MLVASFLSANKALVGVEMLCFGASVAGVVHVFLHGRNDVAVDIFCCGNCICACPTLDVFLDLFCAGASFCNAAVVVAIATCAAQKVNAKCAVEHCATDDGKQTARFVKCCFVATVYKHTHTNKDGHKANDTQNYVEKVKDFYTFVLVADGAPNVHGNCCNNVGYQNEQVGTPIGKVIGEFWVWFNFLCGKAQKEVQSHQKNVYNQHPNLVFCVFVCVFHRCSPLDVGTIISAKCAVVNDSAQTYVLSVLNDAK